MGMAPCHSTLYYARARIAAHGYGPSTGGARAEVPAQGARKACEARGISKAQRSRHEGDEKGRGQLCINSTCTLHTPYS